MDGNFIGVFPSEKNGNVAPGIPVDCSCARFYRAYGIEAISGIQGLLKADNRISSSGLLKLFPNQCLLAGKLGRYKLTRQLDRLSIAKGKGLCSSQLRFAW